jgi:hypothetical protein
VSAAGGQTVVKITGAAPPAATGASVASSDSTQSIVVSGDQYQNVTTSSLNITATAPNSFISTGSGNDVINVSGVGGNTVVDAGGGANFLIGGSSNDTFIISAASGTENTVSTITGFHTGDSATIQGVDLTDFKETVTNNAGLAGASGLGLSFSAPGHPTTELVLAGYSSADLSNGRLSLSSGETPDGPFVTIRAT